MSASDIIRDDGALVPDIAEPVIGRAFARPVGSSGLRAPRLSAREKVSAAAGPRRPDALFAPREAL